MDANPNQYLKAFSELRQRSFNNYNLLTIIQCVWRYKYSILYNFCNIQFHNFPDVKSVQLDNIDRGFYYTQNTVLPLIVSSLSIYQSLAVQTVMNQPV